MELPMWIADPAMAEMNRTDVSRAVAAGLTFRSAEETLRDTADWDATRGEYEPGAGLAAEREQELLHEWHARTRA
jgi:2'-hydroxyisoflavone reductase